MPIRYVFRCEICGTTPDEATRSAIAHQCQEDMFGEFIEAMPGRWLVWHAGGLLGPARYACFEHRRALMARLRFHYQYTGEQWVWKRPPYPQRWPPEEPLDPNAPLVIPESLLIDEHPQT
jgi:hypothetical protein